MNNPLNNKELVAAGHELARHMSSDTPIIDIAKMVTRLASQLDVTAAALRQANAQLDSQSLELKAAVAAEIEWEKAMMQAVDADGIADVVSAIEKLKADSAALADENAALKQRKPSLKAMMSALDAFNADEDVPESAMLNAFNILRGDVETSATDRFIAEQRSQAQKEGAYFVANRMLAAWDAGFIDDTAKNAADIARMILTSTDFMKDAPDGDFDRSFADDMLAAIARQQRDEVKS